MKELELKLWLQSPLLHFDKCSNALSALLLPCQPSSAVTVNNDSCCLNSLAFGVSGLYLMAILLGILFLQYMSYVTKDWWCTDKRLPTSSQRGEGADS